MTKEEYKHQCIQLACQADMLEFPKLCTDNKKMDLIDKHKKDVERNFRSILRVDIDDRLWDEAMDIVNEKYDHVKLNNDYLQELMRTYVHVLCVFYKDMVE